MELTEKAPSGTGCGVGAWGLGEFGGGNVGGEEGVGGFELLKVSRVLKEPKGGGVGARLKRVSGLEGLRDYVGKEFIPVRKQ